MNYTQKRPVFAYEPCFSGRSFAAFRMTMVWAGPLEEYGYAYVELLAVDGCVVVDKFADVEAGAAL